MTTAQRTAFADPELLGLLADRPELLAIADAVAATQAPERTSRRLPRLLVAAAVLAVGLAVLPLAPWRGDDGGLTARALAAIGPLPVVHAVIETQDPHSALVDIESGRRVPTTIRVEYWFDDERARLRSRQLRNGVLQGEALQVGDGGSTSDGPVLALPGTRPNLTPGLAAFVRGYRQALAEGTAREVGQAEVNGREVTWLEFPSGTGSERVAVDRITSLPVLLRTIGADGEPSTLAWRVLTIETTERRASDFTPPRLLPAAPSRGDVRESRTIPAAEAASAVETQVLWLGRSFVGLPLASVELHELTRGFAPQLGRPAEHARGVELVYGDRERFVRLQQARTPEPAYGFGRGRVTWAGDAIPAEGSLAVVDVLSVDRPGTHGCIGQLRRGGTYVTISSSEGELCLAAARALGPVEEEKG